MFFVQDPVVKFDLLGLYEVLDSLNYKKALNTPNANLGFRETPSWYREYLRISGKIQFCELGKLKGSHS